MRANIVLLLLLTLFLAGCTGEGAVISNDFTCVDLCESRPHTISPYLVWHISGVFPDCNCSYEIIEPEISINGTFGSVTIISSPSNASVYLDDVYKGKTPVYIENLTLGMHGLRIEKNTFSPLIQSIYIGSANSTINLDLTPLSLNITWLYIDFESDNTTCPACYVPLNWRTSGVGDSCISYCTEVYNSTGKATINGTSGNVLLMADYHMLESAYAYYDFPFASIGNVTFYFNLAYTHVYPMKDSRLFYYKISENDNNQAVFLEFKPGSYELGTFNLSYPDNPPKSYKANTWHKITTAFNAPGRTWDLYVDNELVSSGLLLISNGVLNRMRFETAESGHNSFSLYIDNITISLLN